ncbi:MAG: sugar phosphate nucleotidyltransferase [Acidobacteriota bacterium]
MAGDPFSDGARTPRSSKPPALLLCAGWGTRLGAAGVATPKPLLDIGGQTILDRLLDALLRLPGLGDVHVVCNEAHRDAFARWAAGRRAAPEAGFGDRRLEVHPNGRSTPSTRRGAVGDLRFLLERVATPAGALVSAGDGIFLFDFGRWWSAFRELEASCLLAVKEQDAADLRRSGVLRLGTDATADGKRLADGAIIRRVLALVEKPHNPPSSFACPALYAFDTVALRHVGPYLDTGGGSDEIGRFVADLAMQDRQLWAVPVAGERLHVGDPASLATARRRLGTEPAMVPSATMTNADVSRGVTTAETARCAGEDIARREP